MRVVSAVADVDREGKGFFLTFTVDRGPALRLRRSQYRDDAADDFNTAMSCGDRF